jgi:hypothetical protein
MFEAIRDAVDELKRETDRVAAISILSETITCGELSKILENAKKSARLLKKIQGRKVDCQVPPCPRGVGDYGAYSRGYRDAQAVLTA